MPRPIMTAAELAQHRVRSHGRDYSLSDDGYGDMEVAAGEKWRAVAGWGRDGWDLGDWPYVVVSLREVDHPGYTISGLHIPLVDGATGEPAKVFEMRQTVEGDTDVYRFDTAGDRDAAVDYLFVWYGLGKEYPEWVAEGLTPDKRDALNAGTLRVDARFRGPFSWARCDAEKAVQS